MTPLEQRCRETLEESWIAGDRDGVPFAYTRPSPLALELLDPSNASAGVPIHRA